MSVLPIDSDTAEYERPEMWHPEQSEYLPPLAPSPVWLRSARGTSLCSRCSLIDRRRFPSPVDVEVITPDDEDSLEPISRVDGTGVVIYRRDLLAQLGEHIGQFARGSVRVAGRGELEDFCTLYTQEPATARFSQVERMSVCEECGSRVAQGQGREFLEVPGRRARPVEQDWQARLYLNRKAFPMSIIDDSGWSNESVSFVPIAVRTI
jgi:hypothetical protein